MKRPKEPTKPIQPVVPNAKILQKAGFINLNKNSTITLAYLLSKIPSNIKHEDVHITYNVEYGRHYYEEYISYTDAYINFYAEIDNPKFDKETVAYNMALEKFKADMATYDIKCTQYLKDKKEYGKWEKEQTIASKQKRIEQLEKQLKKLKNEDRKVN